MNDATETTHEGTVLRQDVTCILLECHRDRLDDGIFRPDADHSALAQFAAHIARRLFLIIGGRYVPKQLSRDERGERDAAIWLAFNGRNHLELMREFCISRRLLYSILARKRKPSVAVPKQAADLQTMSAQIEEDAQKLAAAFKGKRPPGSGDDLAKLYEAFKSDQGD